MNYTESKDKFIKAWGNLGSSWGINRTMAQVHALLLIAPDPLSAEDIMEDLRISRGNVNMNIRALINWGLVHKDNVHGERKEYFIAEKDIWKVATLIMKERRKRELEPALRVLEQVSKVEGDKRDKNIKAFTEAIGNIKSLVEKADSTMEKLIKADESFLTSTLLKLLK
ncbi:MAG: MarR family transcriptional regulator [Bacteroidia bacterium]